LHFSKVRRITREQKEEFYPQISRDKKGIRKSESLLFNNLRRSLLICGFLAALKARHEIA
jgi:hypothetical protein